MFIIINVVIATLVRKGRVNVVYNKKNIIKSIVKSEPYGIHTMDIANDTKIHRGTVSRLCQQLQNDNYISRKNKQSEYHITKKIYGYPELTAFSFGIKAVRVLTDIHRKWVSTPNKFCIDETCKNILDINKNNSNNNAFQAESYRDQLTLLEFATRMGAIIEYVIIQALRPKKLLPDNDSIIEIDVPVKGQDKDDIARNWIDNAINAINVKGIFIEFCRLEVVKRGLAIFADKGEKYMDRPSPALDSRQQNELISKRKTMRQMDTDDPYWSAREMDEVNFRKLVIAFKNTYPDIFDELEKLRKGLPDEIEENIKMAKEEKKRITQLEKDDPDHIKCNGKLVADFRRKEGNQKICSKCGRRLLKI